MADIIINGINLGSTPVADLKEEFFRTGDGEIIGGVNKISVHGSIVGPDGLDIMGRLQSIRLLGENATCVEINTAVHKGQAKVEGVTISQGADPAWINQGEFSIELIAPMGDIPPNKFGFTAADNVREFSRSESLSLGDESHGYLFILQGLKLSKTFVTWTTKMNIRCQPFCDSKGKDAVDLLKNLLYAGPTDTSLSAYTSWKKYFQSRSLDVSGNGAISFSCDAILTDPVNGPPSAFVDVSFSTSDSYAPREETHTISGNIEGLSDISWSDLIGLSDVCNSTKLANAIGAFTNISSILADYDRGFKKHYLPMELILQKNCPKKTTGQEKCEPPEDTSTPVGIKKPTSSSVSTNRITGTIDFTFIWSSSTLCEGEDGSTENTSIDVTPGIQQIAQHTIPRFGTIVQKLGSYTNDRVSFTYTRDTPLGSVSPQGCIHPIGDAINTYFKNNPNTYIKIEWTKSWTLTSFTERQSYIVKCQKNRREPVIEQII